MNQIISLLEERYISANTRLENYITLYGLTSDLAKSALSDWALLRDLLAEVTHKDFFVDFDNTIVYK